MRWEPGTDVRWGWGQPAVRRAAARRVGPLSCSRLRTPLPLYGLCLCGLAEAGGEWPSGPVGIGTTMMGWAGLGSGDGKLGPGIDLGLSILLISYICMVYSMYTKFSS